MHANKYTCMQYAAPCKIVIVNKKKWKEYTIEIQKHSAHEN